MYKRDEEILNETLGSLFSMISWSSGKGSSGK
jgi:hypothetical protein